jgi:glycosyltransferase involved in cell wall biosynthesis
MRIAHVVPTYLPATRYGGPIHSVHGLCRGLACEGHEVHVFTTSVDGPGDSDVPVGVPVPLDGVQVWYFRSRVGRRLYWSPPLGRALGSQIDGFDVVHTHSVFLWPTTVAARQAHRARVPHVLSPRGMLVRELIEERSRGLKTAWLTLIESGNLAGASAVHFTSERELADARALPLPLPQPFVLPNGVEYPAQLPPGPDGGRGGPFALYLGRVSWKKRLDRVLRALVGTDMRLVICGNDDEGLTPTLRRQISELGVGGQVELRPPVHGAEKWSLLSGARFVVLASDNENFGNVVLEAMAVGRPAVVTRGVGAGEILEGAGAGIRCDPTERSLSEAMRALWSEPQRADRMGERGRRHVQAHLTWPSIARSMAERYATLRRR